MIRNLVFISTPEHLKVPFESAGIGSRSLAKFIDFVCVGGILIPIGLVVTTISSFFSLVISYEVPSIIIGICFILLAFIPILYFSLMEYWFKGQTIGKWILRLRVITDDGRHPSFSSIFLRNLLQLVDLLPGFYLLGLATMFVHPKEKRMGDLVAGTLVVQERKGQVKEISLYYTSLSLTKKEREDFQLLTVIPSKQYRVLESFLGRRGDLEPKRRKELAKKLIQMGWPNIEVFAGKEEVFLEKIYLYLREVHYAADRPLLMSKYFPS